MTAFRKEEILGPTDFTIAYRATEEPQIDPSEMPSVLQRLNEDRRRKELPRFKGWVVGLSCAVAGETEGELIDNARNKIEGMIKIRRSRGLPDLPTSGAVEQPITSGDVKTLKIKV